MRVYDNRPATRIARAAHWPRLVLACWLALGGAARAGAAASPLASLDYHIGGTFMQVAPTTLAVPKGIPGSVLVSVFSGGSTNNAAVTQLTSGAYVQAVIRGPGFPAPQVLVSKPNAPLLLPPINLSGNYELDSIALVDAVTGQVRLEGDAFERAGECL